MSNITSPITPSAIIFAPVSAVHPPMPTGISRRVDVVITRLFTMVHCELFGKRYRRTLSTLHEF